MDLPEHHTHTFIVKVWRERLSEHGRRFLLRGHVTHVPSGQRQAIGSLAEILDVILPYVAAMGVPTGWCWRLRHWLRPVARQPQDERSP